MAFKRTRAKKWLAGKPKRYIPIKKQNFHDGKMIEINLSQSKRNQFNDDDLVCYCFIHTKRDIENDYLKNNRSLILEKITLEKRMGKCNCAQRNPKGR
jgi:hypothetical protein